MGTETAGVSGSIFNYFNATHSKVVLTSLIAHDIPQSKVELNPALIQTDTNKIIKYTPRNPGSFSAQDYLYDSLLYKKAKSFITVYLTNCKEPIIEHLPNLPKKIYNFITF